MLLRRALQRGYRAAHACGGGARQAEMERRVRRRSLPALLLAEKTLLQLESLEQQRAEVQAALTAALAAEGGRPSRADASTPIEASVRVAPRLLREPAEDVEGEEAASLPLKL